jgi:Mn-dependent DtxR family transcriptional regulator
MQIIKATTGFNRLVVCGLAEEVYRLERTWDGYAIFATHFGARHMIVEAPTVTQLVQQLRANGVRVKKIYWVR